MERQLELSYIHSTKKRVQLNPLYDPKKVTFTRPKLSYNIPAVVPVWMPVIHS